MLSYDAECNPEIRWQQAPRFIILPFVVAADVKSAE